MTLQEAKELQSMLQQGNPFVRIPAELARKAEQVHKMLLKQEKQQDHAEEPEGLF